MNHQKSGYFSRYHRHPGVIAWFIQYSIYLSAKQLRHVIQGIISNAFDSASLTLYDAKVHNDVNDWGEFYGNVIPQH